MRDKASVAATRARDGNNDRKNSQVKAQFAEIILAWRKVSSLVFQLKFLYRKKDVISSRETLLNNTTDPM